MSNKRGRWLTRRGQADVADAIDQVIEQHPRPGEQVQEIPDELIEDSPYQARQSLDETSMEELAQGMRQVGFQGVLIIRPHGDPAQRRHGYFQLVFGHRRRAAWRRVCAERGEACVVPVVVREVTDERMLTIGAQENLQRADLTALEEAQIVAWHERLFFDKNQAEIGAMLGKSSDWVSVRSRIHALPDALKARLQQRPRAIGQMLELSTFYTQHPARALALADRVMHENLTVVNLRALIRDSKQATSNHSDREAGHNRRANATSVQAITTESHSESAAPSQEQTPEQPALQPAAAHPIEPQSFDAGSCTTSPASRSSQPPRGQITLDALDEAARDLLLLTEAAAALASLAARSKTLPSGAATDRALDQAEQAVLRLRRELTHR
jgi:ParB family chromosome partitioning protein